MQLVPVGSKCLPCYDLLFKCTTELTECCTITSLTKYHFERSDTAPRLIYIKGDYSEDTREYPIGRNEKSESENAWCRKPGGDLPEVWAWDSQEEDHPAIWERKRGEKHKPTSFSRKQR
jgi:hypothetical protein